MAMVGAEDCFDVAVIGGSYAGLSASLQLARARRQVLVIDAGRRRNRFADASHGFLGQDGRPPEAIAADGKAQLLAYLVAPGPPAAGPVPVPLPGSTKHLVRSLALL